MDGLLIRFHTTARNAHIEPTVKPNNVSTIVGITMMIRAKATYMPIISFQLLYCRLRVGYKLYIRLIHWE